MTMSAANAATDGIAAARAAGRTALDEHAGKALLAAHGVRVPRSVVVAVGDDPAAAVAGLAPPWVVKVMSPEILHKSDVGGVRVGVATPAEVAAVIGEMAVRPGIAGRRLDGFLVEEMAPKGVEVVVGGVRDPQFGPLVMVGLGGIFVEVLKDVAFRICPITRLDAGEMLAELRGAPLLDGARGGKAVSKDAIVDVLLRVGGADGLLLRHADAIREADINPLIVSETGAVAVDARFILA
jgi:acyl-CoA synthetase (NDP forming)